MKGKHINKLYRYLCLGPLSVSGPWVGVRGGDWETGVSSWRMECLICVLRNKVLAVNKEGKVFWTFEHHEQRHAGLQQQECLGNEVEFHGNQTIEDFFFNGRKLSNNKYENHVIRFVF